MTPDPHIMDEVLERFLLTTFANKLYCSLVRTEHGETLLLAWTGAGLPAKDLAWLLSKLREYAGWQPYALTYMTDVPHPGTREHNVASISLFRDSVDDPRNAATGP